MRILIADDDRVSRRLLEGALVQMGHEVVSVADGLEAIRVSALPDSPPLAILDWMMPGADGLAVCHAIRQRAAPYVYIILLTARSRQEDMVAGLDAEADDFLKKPLDAVELRARLRSGERVLALQERLLVAQETLRHQATHDVLTGIWNRGMVVDQLERELARGRREGQSLAVVLADIDHFKAVNDTYGHAAGDAVLRETAARLVGVPRRYDFVGRYGGEEFLLVLPNCEMPEAAIVAERVRRAVAGDPIRVGTIELAMSVSLGVACTSGTHDAPDILLQKADEALYRAKAMGRNRAEFWPIVASPSFHGTAELGLSGQVMPDRPIANMAPDRRGPSFLAAFSRGMARNGASAWMLRNAREGQIVAVTLIPAFDRSTRNKGLLGRHSLEKGSAMILAPCSSVHTFFMRFAIDILFVSREGRVLKMRARCRPWRLALGGGAFAVIELPAGAVEASSTRIGDRLEIS